MTERRLKIFVLLICVFGFWFLVFGFSRAQTRPSASLFFAMTGGTFRVGESFNLGIRLSSPDETCNAAQGTIRFSNNLLEVVRVSQAGSIFTLWPQAPTFSNADGTISFAGGLPNPGFKGGSALIFTVTFRGKKQGTADVNFSSGTILANDGFGTDITKALGSGRYTITAAEVAPPAPAAPVGTPVAPAVSSPTHPDQNKWYANRTAEFKWPLVKNITGVSILFNQSPRSDPGNLSDGLFNSRTFAADRDGVWYLHIKLKNSAGWGEITHFKTQIDTEPPLPFSVFVKEDTKITEFQPTLIFEASDATSGIDYYQISIDDKEPVTWRKTKDSTTFKIPEKLPAGKHSIKVIAFDFAGNYKESEKEIEIIKAGPPIIEFITSKLWSGDPIVVEGSSPPKSNVILKITDKQTGAETQHDISADERGRWFFAFKKILPAGKYELRAALVTPEGIESPFTEPFLILILKPYVFYLWLAGLITLSITFIIQILLLLYYWKKIKKRRK